jgi:hypothetical protein
VQSSATTAQNYWFGSFQFSSQPEGRKWGEESFFFKLFRLSDLSSLDIKPSTEHNLSV